MNRPLKDFEALLFVVASNSYLDSWDQFTVCPYWRDAGRVGNGERACVGPVEASWSVHRNKPRRVMYLNEVLDLASGAAHKEMEQ
jgi:hypothetical protein